MIFIVQQLPVVPGAGIQKPIFKSNDVMHQTQREIYGHDPAFFFRPLQRWRRFGGKRAFSNDKQTAVRMLVKKHHIRELTSATKVVSETAMMFTGKIFRLRSSDKSVLEQAVMEERDFYSVQIIQTFVYSLHYHVKFTASPGDP
jgi:hypothetical protein